MFFFAMFYRRQLKVMLVLLLIVQQQFGQIRVFAADDFVLERVYEAALDLPRIYFLLKRTSNGPLLGTAGQFELNYAFLDTGTSGILLSRETAEQMGIHIDPKARFLDVGVGGMEYFSISEPLYIGLADYEAQNPESPDIYKFLGPARCVVKNKSSGLLTEPIDVIGMPAMVGRITVLNSGATNSLEYFAADIRNEKDRLIPKADIEVSLKLRKFNDLEDPNNIPPLPMLAYNPVIDNIEISFRGKHSRGNWLFDTGATISFISTMQADKLGLTDENGNPKIKPVFSVPIGGVGEMRWIQGFEIDRLLVPSSLGPDIVFKNARVGVHNIKYYDKDKGEYRTIDGVFGSNFLCASAKMEGLLPSEVSETIFEHIILDMRRRTLGFDIRDDYKKAR